MGLQSGSMNFYQYVGNDPTDAIDPSGLKSFRISESQASDVVKWIKSQRDLWLGARYPRFYSKDFVDETPERQAQMEQRKWDGRSNYRNEPILNPDTYGLLESIAKISGQSRISILQIMGHAQWSQGITIGAGKTTDEVNLTYVDPNNAVRFARMLKEALGGKKPDLLILASCGLGLYTRSDTPSYSSSVVQRIADTLDVPILSPGGFAEGSLIDHNAKVSAELHGHDEENGTRFEWYDRQIDNNPTDSARLEAEKNSGYDSEACWFLTIPTGKTPSNFRLPQWCFALE